MQLSRGRVCCKRAKDGVVNDRADHKGLRQGVESQLQRRSGEIHQSGCGGPLNPHAPHGSPTTQHRETCRQADFTASIRSKCQPLWRFLYSLVRCEVFCRILFFSHLGIFSTPHQGVSILNPMTLTSPPPDSSREAEWFPET